MFIFYLDFTLKGHAIAHPILLNSTAMKPQYADDVDMVNCDRNQNEAIMETLPTYCKESSGLIINAGKTERTDITPQTVNTLDVRKLGSKISDPPDVRYKMAQATVAFKDCNKIWSKPRQIRIENRMKLYNACVKPMIMYNASTLGCTDRLSNTLDAFHRKHLRIVKRVFYPQKITTEELYQSTNSRPLSQDILVQRWRLFGHILRQPLAIPANRVMQQYFNPPDFFPRPRPGGPKSTLPRRLHLDLQNFLLPKDTAKLKTAADLHGLRIVAHDRLSWAKLIEHMSHNQIISMTDKAARRKRLRSYTAADRLPAVNGSQENEDPPEEGQDLLQAAEDAPPPKRIRFTLLCFRFPSSMLRQRPQEQGDHPPGTTSGDDRALSSNDSCL
jgi:hypothetical protein